MITRKSLPTCILGACLLVVLGTPGMSSHVAFGQDEGVDATIDAHRDREQLLAMVADLQSELAAARKRITLLEAEIATLNSGSAPPTETAPRSPEATGFNPENLDLPYLANPLRIRSEIQADLIRAWKDEEIVPTVPLSDMESSDWKQYARWAERWIERTNRSYQKPIEWPVRIVASQPIDDKKTQLLLISISPDGTTDIRPPFTVVLPKRSVERAQRQSQSLSTLILRGTFKPSLRLNKTRLEEGPFNNPPLLAPMIDYRWSVDAKNIAAPPRAKNDSSAAKTGEN